MKLSWPRRPIALPARHGSERAPEPASAPHGERLPYSVAEASPISVCSTRGSMTGCPPRSVRSGQMLEAARRLAAGPGGRRMPDSMRAARARNDDGPGAFPAATSGSTRHLERAGSSIPPGWPGRPASAASTGFRPTPAGPTFTTRGRCRGKPSHDESQTAPNAGHANRAATPPGAYRQAGPAARPRDDRTAVPHQRAATRSASDTTAPA
jgi:hypothetical protein